MAHILSVASGKGGVGKTLLTSSMGISLSRKGKRVLLIDGDMGMRNMDLALGVENECLYHILDLSEGKCFPKDVILSIDEHLDFIPAAPSGTWEDIIPAALDTVLEDVDSQYDYILLDCPAGVGSGIQYASRVSEKMVLVVAPSWASKRNADQLIHMVGRKIDCTMILNQFSQQDDTQISFSDMVETVDPDYFAGVIPYSAEADRLAHEGELTEFSSKGAFGKAVTSVLAAILEGKNYPYSRWEHLLQEAAREEEASKETLVKEKTNGLSWHSTSYAYKWRRRR